MPRKKSNSNPISIESVKHKDRRANIPTEELRDFVAEDEKRPKAILYPRDTSLDPQLVWKGKDEQDSKDLSVPVVPIYIQEKIAPQAIIENLLMQQKKQSLEPQTNLFSDFNGIEFERLIEFYQHEQKWSNRMILGDSLLVMTSLAEKEGLKGKVQMIYIDPPYGIKFGSNWQVSTRKRDVKDGKAEDATRQPEQVRAFRDTWKLGIHSYLAYLRDRLTAARELLTESGSVFVQIGDENVHLVRCVMDEVFGSENFISVIVFQKTGGQSSKLLASSSDFILWYAKKREVIKYRQLFQIKTAGEGVGEQYRFVELANGEKRRMTAEELEDVSLLPSGSRVFRPTSIEADTPSDSTTFEFESGDMIFEARSWKTNSDGMRKLTAAGRIMAVGKRPNYIRYLDDFPVSPFTDVWGDTMGARDLVYVVQTNTKIVERCLLMTTDPGDLVLDPTCGSGSTAFVAEQWGRRWITIDTSRVALALARTRIMSAKYPYYLLADSPEGVQKEAEIKGKVPPGFKTEEDIRKGFVYKRVPHVTLKSIANNPDIKEGMSREQIDAAIARHADTEILYDQPYEDNKRIRVTGPFTVESLSPHRVLATDEERPASEREAAKAPGPGQFETMILDNLKKAGVQNTIKDERLKFDRLEPYAGEWLHAVGEYTGKVGTVRRVAISIGPEHGTVGPEQIKEAAKEALKGIGFDLLVICGLAFDAHSRGTAMEFSPERQKKSDGFAVAEESRQYGKLPMLLARINPDLTMGDELLKKTGAGNLFMVFGEPDIDIQKHKDGKIIVEIKGLDVYDPTTGEIRSHSTDDIACWFIDTDYNEESFFVRHAYFCGVDEPYEKLKRALRAEINETAWSALYSTKSLPFDPPANRKIAVKVINHYGDEVMRVFDLSSVLGSSGDS